MVPPASSRRPATPLRACRPALGFWLLALAFALLAADALTRLRLGPWARLAALAVAAVAVAPSAALRGLERSVAHARNTPTAPTASGARRSQHLCAGPRLAGGGRARRPAARHPLPPRPALAGGDPAGAQHRPDDPEHRAVRHPDGAARLSRRARAARRRARHPRHRRGAGLVALFLYSLLPVVANTVSGSTRCRPPSSMRRAAWA